MKKLLLTSAAIATFFASTTAYGSEGSKFFLTANAGLSKTATVQSFKSDTDMYFGLGVGYYIAPNIRVSVTFDHFFNPTHKLNRKTPVSHDYLKYSNNQITALNTNLTTYKNEKDKKIADLIKYKDELMTLTTTWPQELANAGSDQLKVKQVRDSYQLKVNTNENASKATTDNIKKLEAAEQSIKSDIATYQALVDAHKAVNDLEAQYDKAQDDVTKKKLEQKLSAASDALDLALEAVNKIGDNKKLQDTTTTAQVVHKAKGTIDVLLVNAFVDVFEVDSFKLFVGAGVGMGQVGTKITTTIDGVEQPEKVEYKKTMGVAFAAYVGASYELTDGVNAELMYSYRDLGQGKTPAGEKAFHYTGHHVGAGIRFDL